MSEHHTPEREQAPASAEPTEPTESALSERRSGDLASRLTDMRRPAIILLFVYAVLLIVLNTKRVSISLVLFTIHTELLVLIAVSGLVGFACGYLVRRRKEDDRGSGS
jgi:uncharacterized integral membrane protein